MAEMRRCNRCGNLLPSDTPEGTCPACTLRAGLEPETRPAAEGSPSENVTFGFQPVQPGHVLESLARSIGPIPRVLLPETGADDTTVGITQPSSDEMPAPAERGSRYQLFGEIARGGMGAVLRGRDPDLGRDLAVKVLLETHEDKPDLLRRFVEEAQIGGQLQHPGIVPVYELGAFADRRPYFTMKLVKGRTLASLLAERSSSRSCDVSTVPPYEGGIEGGSGVPATATELTPSNSPFVRGRETSDDFTHDLPRFLSIFEAICQTMAYTHARGVIHRDLKPSNIMVGSFGEVQVMDWGLAKVLKEGGAADEPPNQPAPEESLVATVRSGSNLDESQAGSVLGTPAYMAPEQAAGETGRVDRRADVFGLGSILCEILTGQPAFTGTGAIDILRKAIRGDTADALARLDGCGAEAELIALARDCLIVEPEDRPRDAGVVAERMTAYLAGVQERVQAAERERAVAVAKAIEERRRRKVQLALAASVLALTTLGGLSTTYYLRQRAARAAAGERVIDQVTTLRGQALEHPEEIQRWEIALAAAVQADPAGDPKTRAQLLALQKEIRAGKDAAKRDKALLDRVVDIRSAKADDPDGSATDADYAEAFREAGLDLSALPPAEAGARIRSRPPVVAIAMAAALDDWAGLKRGNHQQITEAARIADPDPARNDLREALTLAEKSLRVEALKALARKEHADELGAVSVDLLGKALLNEGELPAAEAVLRRALRLHSGDVWVNYTLGSVLEKLSRRDEAIRFYTAARAIRPETAHELAHALAAKGQTDEAIDVFRDLTRLRPKDGRHLLCLGKELKGRGRSEEIAKVLEQAVTGLREELGLNPNNFKAQTRLAMALHDQGKNDEAVVKYRAAIRFNPHDVMALVNLGLALEEQGKHDEAIASFREAILHQPGLAGAHANLGIALRLQGKPKEAVASLREAIRIKSDDTLSHRQLGDALSDLGSNDEAIAEYRTAIRLNPEDPLAHVKLGILLCRGYNDHAAGEREIRTGLRIKPDSPDAHGNLGVLLLLQGKHAEAISELRETIRLKPDSSEAHAKLGEALSSLGRLDEADAESHEAIRLKPDFAPAHISLGTSLLKQGKRNEAIEEFRKVIEIQPEDAMGHASLAHALADGDSLEEARTQYREAIRLKPDEYEVHVNFGALLCERFQDYPAAESEFRAAIRLKPDSAQAHYNLGSTFERQGKLDDTIAEYGTVIRLNPNDAGVYSNLGRLLGYAGRHDDAIEACHQAIRLDPKGGGAHYNLGNSLAAKGRLLGALAAFREAERFEPALCQSRQWQLFYHAACAAARAGSGQGKDEPPPDDTAKARLRQQALDWLKAELTTWTKLLDSGPPQYRLAIVQTLDQWKQHTDLAGIRDALALARLPEAERKEWQALWANVDSLQNRAGTTIPEDGVKADSAEVLASIHKRAHELAPSKPAQAEPLFRQALEGYRKIQGPDGVLTIDLTFDLANHLAQTGRIAEAESLLRVGLEQARKRFGPDDPRTVNIMTNLGANLFQQAKWTAAEPLLRTALDQARKQYGPDDPRTAGILAPLGLTLIQQSKWTEAEPVLRDCLAIREKLQPDEWTTFNTRSLLGGSLLGQKKYAEAEPQIVSGYEGMKAREAKIPPPANPRFTDAAERVVKLYEAWGKKGKADEWRAKLAKPSDGPKK